MNNKSANQVMSHYLKEMLELKQRAVPPKIDDYCSVLKDLLNSSLNFLPGNVSNENVVIETTMVNTGDIHNGMTVICRAAVDYSKWYEFRLSATNDYALYYYDQERKEKDGLNPYLELERGVSEDIKPMLENVVKVSCIDTTLRLEVNGTEVFLEETDLIMDGGLVGLGAISFDLQPVIVKFDYIDVSKAK